MSLLEAMQAQPPDIEQDNSQNLLRTNAENLTNTLWVTITYSIKVKRRDNQESQKREDEKGRKIYKQIDDYVRDHVDLIKVEDVETTLVWKWNMPANFKHADKLDEQEIIKELKMKLASIFVYKKLRRKEHPDFYILCQVGNYGAYKFRKAKAFIN